MIPGFTVEEYKAELAKNPEFVRKMQMAGAIVTLLTPGSSILSVFRLKGAAQITEYTLTNTVAKNLATRPFLNSPLLVEEIMATGPDVTDATFAGGMNWVVQGTMNGSKGIYELGVNPETKVIYHFLFKTIK